jgi:hypothetical protein
MTPHRRRAAAAPLVALVVALMWSASHLAGAGFTAQPFELVLARFNTAAPPAYRAFRRLEAGAGSSRHGWIEVRTEHRPGRGLTFEVTDEGGHEYVRNKVLRNFLENEQRLIARGQPLRAALDTRNYEFADGGKTKEGLQRVVLKAARKSDGIVNGALFLAPDASYVARIEGRLVKSLSFWLRDVDVTWKYARIGQHVMPVEMTSAGRVRLVGRSNFRMTYDYVSIDGRPVPGALKAAMRDEQ